MNNIELNNLKINLKQFLSYTDKQVENIGILSDKKLLFMKKEIEKVKKRREKSTADKHARNLAEKKINDLFKDNPNLEEKEVLSNVRKDSKSNLDSKEKQRLNNIKKVKKTEPIKTNKNRVISEPEPKPKPKQNKNTVKPKKNNTQKPKKPYENKKKVKVPYGRKPKILMISDVKGWAWWNKSQYIKKYLNEYYDIDIKCILGDDSTPYHKINQKAYDLFFTWGFSYIDGLHKIPKYKKVTGVTAHRAQHAILPKMKQAGWHHANSIMLLKEMHKMGFSNTFYVPNGIDTELFRPIEPIKETGKLIAGHVGKECPVKGQRDIIFPAMKAAGVRSYSNTRNWKDKIPLKDMPYEYAKMHTMLVSSREDGTPNPALEAMACGRPVISNKIGNMPEIIVDGENGFLVPMSKDVYIEKINFFKNNRDELIRMGNNARKSIENGWDWEFMSRNYLKMFDTIFDINRDESKYENIAFSHLRKV